MYNKDVTYLIGLEPITKILETIVLNLIKTKDT